MNIVNLVMVTGDFSALYKYYRPKYYTNKEFCKSELKPIIKQLGVVEKRELIRIFEKHNWWKEYDYFIYSQLLLGNEAFADISFVSFQIIRALGTKEIVIVAMNIFKLLSHRIDLQTFMTHLFKTYNQSQLDMSFYAYLLPAIKSTFGDEGLTIIQSCNCSYLCKLHAMRFIQRITFKNFIVTSAQYLDGESTALLFELICKRREKVLPYESQEIDFIYLNLAGIDPPAINYFKYFLSHICVNSNRIQTVDIDFFEKLQTKCYLLLHEHDIMKVKRGLTIYVDLYNCLIKSQYKTNYTLTAKDLYDAKLAPVYLQLKASNTLRIGSEEHLRIVLSAVNNTNFFLFEEIFDMLDCENILQKEQVIHFYNNLEDDYLEDKIDVIIKLLIKNWHKDKEQTLISSIIQQIDTIKVLCDSNINYNIYRHMNMIKSLIDYLDYTQRWLIENWLMKIIDFIVLKKENNSKLYERIIVCAIDLLCTLATAETNIAPVKLVNTLCYLEKGIFFNRRYTASATGLIYRKFIACKFLAHKDSLIHYLDTILKLEEKQIGQSGSSMRRCLEIRTLVHEFCLGVPKNFQKEITDRICKFCLEQLNEYRKKPTDTSSNQRKPHWAYMSADALKIYIFFAYAILSDATLKAHTFDYVFPLIKFCLDSIDVYSKDFSICNAIYTLYSALVQRLLPHNENTKNMTVDDLTILCGLFHIDLSREWNAFGLGNLNRTSALLLLLFQRTNNETPFKTTVDSPAVRIKNQLWAYFTQFEVQQHCSYSAIQTENAIYLWVNLTPQDEIYESLINLNSMKDLESGGLNNLNLKHKLLESLSRKYNCLLKQRNLLRELVAKNEDEVFEKKISIRPTNILRHLCLRPLTIKATIKRILSRQTGNFEKLLAFQFFFEYYCQHNLSNIFLHRFLCLYIQTFLSLPSHDFQKNFIGFRTSFKTLVHGLVDLPEQFEQQILISPNSLLIDLKTYDKIASTPTLLAFLTICLPSIQFCNIPIPNQDLITLKIVEAYNEISSELDKLLQEDAECIILAFKYLKFFVKDPKKGQLLVIALRFLHSELLGQCDYLIPHILEALEVTNLLENGKVYVTNCCTIRYLLSEMFLDQYFYCPRQRILSLLHFLKWKHNFLLGLTY